MPYGVQLASPLARGCNSTNEPDADAFFNVEHDYSRSFDFVRIAVPALTTLTLLLWVTRIIVSLLEERRILSMAEKLRTLPMYTDLQAIASAMRPLPQTTAARPSPPLPPAAAAASSGDDAGDAAACVVCYAPAIDHTVELLPCGHSQFCPKCLVQLWHYSGVYRHLRCPLCRQVVELMLPVLTESATPSADDILLLRRYNGGLNGVRRFPWIDQWVLRLRALTDARFLPIVVGLRIAILHVTMFVYLLMPRSVVLQSPSSSPLSSGKEALPVEAPVPITTALLGLLSRTVHGAAWYADDAFFISISIILAGNVLQKALFRDVQFS